MQALQHVIARQHHGDGSRHAPGHAPGTREVVAGEKQRRLREAEHIIDVGKTYAEHLHGALDAQLKLLQARVSETATRAELSQAVSVLRGEMRSGIREGQRLVLELILGPGAGAELVDRSEAAKAAGLGYEEEKRENMGVGGSGGSGQAQGLGTASGLVVHKGPEMSLVGADGRLYKGREGGTVLFSPTNNTSKAVFKSSVLEPQAEPLAGVIDATGGIINTVSENLGSEISEPVSARKPVHGRQVASRTPQKDNTKELSSVLLKSGLLSGINKK
jgi:hypothetical protein